MNSVGSKKSPGRDPPVRTCAPLAIVSVTIRSTLAAWRSLTIGPDLNSLTERVADDEILGLSYEGFDIRVSNAFVYDVSAAGEADLYLVEKGGPCCCACLGLDVHTIQYDVGIVPTKLEGERLSRSLASEPTSGSQSA